jgi:O-antigen/teichoic acid export membrane protein
LENLLFGRILRQISRNQRFLYHLASTYALLGVNMVTMFFLTPMLIHHLGNEGYGIWMLLFGITNYFNLSSFGFGQTFTLELIKKQQKAGDVNRLVNTLLFSLIFFACATFPIFLVIHFNLGVFRISESFLRLASRSLWLIYLVFFLNFIAQLPANILFARNKLGLRNAIEIGKVLASFGLTIWVIKSGGNIARLSAVTVLVTLVYLLVLFWNSRVHLQFELNFKYYSKKLFRKFLKPSLHFFMLGLAMQIIVFSDSLLVSSLQSPALVAAYSIALRIPDVAMRLIFKIADVKVPKIPMLFDKEGWLELWHLHNRLFWLTFGAAGAILLFLLLFGRDVIQLWMGSDFHLNETLLLIFALNMFTQCLLHVPAVFLQSLGMHQRASILSMIGAPISIGMAWWFSKSFGLEGIALAMCGTQFLVGIFVIPQFYRFIQSKLSLKDRPMHLFQLK